MNETQLVAYYVSKLNVTSQVYFYAQHLEKIVEDNERRAALDYAERCGMDVLSITKRIVENVRRKPEEVDAAGNLQVSFYMMRVVKKLPKMLFDVSINRENHSQLSMYVL